MGSVEIPPGQPWVTPVSEQDLLDEFSGWGSDVMALLGCIRNPSKWSIHAVYPPLETYVSGNIALIGDSVCTPTSYAEFKALCSLISPDCPQAHAMLPHLGAGAGQGFEDVLVLCRLLSEPQTNASNIAVGVYWVLTGRSL
jgi:salicylate hydroxylase